MRINEIKVFRNFAVVSIGIASVVLTGCAAIVPPNPDDVVRHPFGTEAVKVGMTKNEVESLWGKPDDVSVAEDKEKWKGPREVWVYHGQYSAIPVDAGYLSKTKKLYFDGDNLTNIGAGD